MISQYSQTKSGIKVLNKEEYSIKFEIDANLTNVKLKQQFIKIISEFLMSKKFKLFELGIGVKHEFKI